MVTRTVEISREPSHLCVRDGQLLILRRGPDEKPRPIPATPPNLAGSVPLEDLGVLMVDERETTYTHSLLAQLAEHGAALVVCGRDHHPAGMYLPLNTNTKLLARLDAQLNAPKPRVKRLWQSIVRAKIIAQAANVVESPPHPVRVRLGYLASTVRSGDPDNREGVAAAVYWPAVFAGCPCPQPFRRRAGEGGGDDPNGPLDYGYSALRACVARELVAAGLLPALGIKHIGRGNPFCLADDLMEPLRPIMDARVRYLALSGQWELSRDTKAELLKVLAEPVVVRGESGPLMVGVSRMVGAFVRVLVGEQGDMRPADFPMLPHVANARRTSEENFFNNESTTPDSPVEEGEDEA